MNDVLEYLDAEKSALVTHDGADYCYTWREDDVSPLCRTVSPEEALEKGWATIREGRFFVGSFDICPVEIDYRVTRRRVEDALRKTASKGDLIRIAAILNVTIA